MLEDWKLYRMQGWFGKFKLENYDVYSLMYIYIYIYNFICIYRFPVSIVPSFNDIEETDSNEENYEDEGIMIMVLVLFLVLVLVLMLLLLLMVMMMVMVMMMMMMMMMMKW